VFKVNGADGKAIWKASGVPDGVSDPAITFDAANVYVVGKSTLLAFKQGDGSIAWQATLSDDFANNDCADCLSVIGKSVIVKTKDEAIQAFDTATGKALWTHDLESSSGRVFKLPTQLVVLDEHRPTPTKREVGLTPLDPATGEAGAPMQPVCVDPQHPSSSDELSTSDIVRHSTRSADALVVVYGSSPACFQTWDTVAGTMTSNLYLPEISPSSSSFSFVEADAGVFVANSSELAFVWNTDGHEQQLAKTDNVQYATVAISGSMLIAQATNNRGTTKTSLQGYDLGTGNKNWEVLMGSATSIDGETTSSFSTSSQGTYTAHVNDGKLAIVLFTHASSDNNHLSVLTVDTTTGTVAPRVELDPKTKDIIPDFGPSNWSGSRVVVRIGDDTIQEINTASGQTESVFTGP
jgi:outer membrane protein assembly factor BamB